MRWCLALVLLPIACRDHSGPTYIGVTQGLDTTGTTASDDDGVPTSASATTAMMVPGETSSTGVTESSSTGGGDPSACSASSPCRQDSYCVAPYANAVRGTFECVDACVGPDDEDHWCFDASACCDPAAVCTIRGYCISPGASTGTDGGSSSSG